MLKPEVVEELERQVARWAAAYTNVGAYAKRLAEIDANRAMVEEKLDFEAGERDAAEAAVNALIEDVSDDDDVKEVEAIISRVGGPAMVGGMVDFSA